MCELHCVSSLQALRNYFQEQYSMVIEFGIRMELASQPPYLKSSRISSASARTAPPLHCPQTLPCFLLLMITHVTATDEKLLIA
jgi:hypothetical protein